MLTWFSGLPFLGGVGPSHFTNELLTLVKKKSGVTVPELLLHAPSFIQGVVLQLGAEEEPAVNLYILPH